MIDIKRVVKLTTFDNPWDPIEQWEAWHYFDTVILKHDCDSRIARIAKVTNNMTSEEEDREVERAIDEIILYDPFNIYRKVVKEEKESD